jgi:hypothetical protein
MEFKSKVVQKEESVIRKGVQNEVVSERRINGRTGVQKEVR